MLRANGAERHRQARVRDDGDTVSGEISPRRRLVAVHVVDEHRLDGVVTCRVKQVRMHQRRRGGSRPVHAASPDHGVVAAFGELGQRIAGARNLELETLFLREPMREIVVEAVLTMGTGEPSCGTWTQQHQ